MAKLSLEDPITNLSLVGESYAHKLARLDIHTVADLLHHYPSRYLDRSSFTSIGSLVEGEPATIVGEITTFKNIYTRTGKNLQQATVTDDTGAITITWFNQRYLERALNEGATFAFSGKVKTYHGHLTLTAPEFERVSHRADTTSPTTKYNAQNTNLHTGRLVPVYPETAGVSSKWLRSRIAAALKIATIADHLPQSILTTHHLKPLDFALHNIHFPKDQDTLKAAKHRLAFDELFLLQLQGALKRRQWHHRHTSYVITPDNSAFKAFLANLPFQLTKAQHAAVNDILADLAKERPMNRLLEGDVGSGKTVVAAAAAFAAAREGYRTLLMAPTEILANQHYQKLQDYFSHTHLKVGLYTSATKTTHSADVTVGTHALLFNLTPDPKLALIVVDEQHRFGVKQRAQLEELSANPHRLTMSATPIPRSIALTLYGDLDVSVIDQLPQDKKPTKTWLVPHSKRSGAYSWIREQINDHHAQAFVVCPLIDPSESFKLSQIKSASQEFEHLTGVFPDLKLALLHGRTPKKDKARTIKGFTNNQINLLVTTSVIEVGVDIPGASIIIIEAAERFGLAQLHQLRGRVGRRGQDSYCLLFTSQDNKTENRRLSALTKLHSGFKLAQIDLKLRGPGQVFGVDQHGFSDLKLANLTDIKLRRATHQAALDLISTDPSLASHPNLANHLPLSFNQSVAAN